MSRKKKAEEAPPAIAARNLGPEIEILRSFQISASRIAFLLDEDSSNIRQISRRSQFPKASLISVTALPTREQQIEDFRLYGQRRQAVEDLEWQVEETFNQYASRYEFVEGAKVLGSFLSSLSTPKNPRKVRLKARIHHHIAWFSIQQGKCRSALDHGQFAMWLSRQAYQASWDVLDLNRYVETALIVSMAAHLSAERTDRSETYSLAILWLAQQAAEAAGNPRGSEHFRQRGSALFNLGYEEDARKCLIEAMQRAREKNEARDENHVEMIGKRFLNLLGKSPDFDSAQGLLSKVESTFGRDSLEYAINVNYTAAAGLLTNDPKIAQGSVDLLRLNAEMIASFGRQATVTKLLSITPDLRLNDAQLGRWIKQALRANALRNL
jgi:tetratricopeptide (TPR) repeat protein